MREEEVEESEEAFELALEEDDKEIKNSQKKAKRFPISNVIKDITGYSIISVDISNPLHKQIVTNLKNALTTILTRDNIFHARRANDISDNTQGECFEDRIVRYFNSISQNMVANRLVEKGYPNIVIKGQDGSVLVYIEVKVTSTARASKSSARDFYISPGSIRNCKVTTLPQIITYTFEISPGITSRKIQANAPHLLILGIVENLGSSSKYPGYNDWKLIRFKFYDLFNLDLKTKIEFNANYSEIERKCKEL